MDQLHVHLFINHLPIAGTILGTFVLILALWFRSKHTEMAAYAILVLSSLGTAVAYLTGEGAEHGVKKIPGIVKDTIERHEDFSVYAFTAMILIGILSVIGIILAQTDSKIRKQLSLVILICSIIGFGLIAWTAYLGGQIRHTEISGSHAAPYQIHGIERSRKLP